MNPKLLSRLALIGAVGAGIAAALAYREHLTQENLQWLVARLGIWGPLAYLAIYIVGTVLSLPGSIITLAGGALFGPVWGALYVLIGSVSGASLAFLISRHVAGEWVERKATGIVRQVKEGVEAEGWKFVAFVRLVPAFPFNLVNYVFGLTRIPLRTYVWSSALFMLPGIAGYVYLGHAGAKALTGGENLVRIVTGAGLVFAALILVPMLVRHLRARRKATHSAGKGGSDPAAGPPADGRNP